MSDMNNKYLTEKIYNEVTEAVYAGVYRKMGYHDILSDIGEPYGETRIDKLVFAQMLAENEELYARFKAKVSEAVNRSLPDHIQGELD